MEDIVVRIERTDTGYSAYAPALPGCVTVGDTIGETQAHDGGSRQPLPRRVAPFTGRSNHDVAGAKPCNQDFASRWFDIG